MVNNKLWAVKFDGKRMHVEYATRLPRKTKKFVRMVYALTGEEYNDFVVVNPKFHETVGKWASSNKNSVSDKSEN
jgi:hypothetical protein